MTQQIVVSIVALIVVADDWVWFMFAYAELISGSCRNCGNLLHTLRLQSRVNDITRWPGTSATILDGRRGKAVLSPSPLVEAAKSKNTCGKGRPGRRFCGLRGPVAYSNQCTE